MISHAGEVPKRLKGLVSKTDSGRKSSEGSNPSFSANNENKARTKMRVFFVFGIIEALPKNRLIRFRPNRRNKPRPKGIEDLYHCVAIVIQLMWR